MQDNSYVLYYKFLKYFLQTNNFLQQVILIILLIIICTLIHKYQKIYSPVSIIVSWFPKIPLDINLLQYN